MKKRKENLAKRIINYQPVLVFKTNISYRTYMNHNSTLCSAVVWKNEL